MQAVTAWFRDEIVESKVSSAERFEEGPQYATEIDSEAVLHLVDETTKANLKNLIVSRCHATICKTIFVSQLL